MSATATRVAIIGGGVAGLATAALLADDGYDVDVYEPVSYTHLTLPTICSV